MPKIHMPRSGSIAYWPRKRAAKILPSANWDYIETVSKQKGLLGFIAYKAGMARILAKDSTNDSLTKGKQIVIPVTIIECPTIKIFSVRFYKNNRVAFEILNKDLDNDLKRKIKLPKKQIVSLEEAEKRSDEFDNVRVLVYTLVKKINLKKSPDLLEMGIGGTLAEKLDFVKNNLNKELNVGNAFTKNQLVDIRALTRGLGSQGPVKRFGIGLRSHKAEKGQRRPGNLGSWTPCRVSFRVAQMGQLGFFTRNKYNNKIIDILSNEKLPFSIENYGKIDGSFLVIKGSIQGTPKRQMVLSAPVRGRERKQKETYEIIKFMK